MSEDGRVRPRRWRTAFTLARLLPAYVAAGVLRHVVSLNRLARWAWRDSPAGAADAAEANRLAAAVTRLGRIVPGDRNCLRRSLVLYRELSARGADPRLVVGFRRGTRGLQGHAWVTLAGGVVGDDAAYVASFTPTCCFGRAGRSEPLDADGPSAR
jgi:hypothetical protein